MGSSRARLRASLPVASLLAAAALCALLGVSVSAGLAQPADSSQPGGPQPAGTERADGTAQLPIVASDVPVADVLAKPRTLATDLVAAMDIPAVDVGPEGRRIAEIVASRNTAILEEQVQAERVINRSRRLSVLEARQARLIKTEREALDRLGKARTALRSYAVAAFTDFGTNVRPSGPIGDQTDRTKQLNGEAGGVFTATVAQREEELDAVRADITQAADLHQRLSAERADAQIRRDEAEIVADQAEASRSKRERRFERELLRMEFPDTSHLTVIAVNAYYNAEVLTERIDPGCGVQWWQLAGIGRVESIHGFFGGSTLDANGQTTEDILGPVLDGEKFLAIADTDLGELDGDLEWDRAVGPMQFIPGSWQRYGADGNKDRVIDPHNMYDATLAAAGHLCGSNRNMIEEASFTRALLGYNRSVRYGNQVKEFAEKYRLILPNLSPLPTAEEQLVLGPDTP